MTELLQDLDITIILARPWLSQNQLNALVRGSTRWKYRAHMDSLQREVTRWVESTGFDRCFVELDFLGVRYSTGELDVQNAQGGLKALQDVLVPATRANPYGLGLIAGDDPKVLKNSFVDQVVLPRSRADESRTEITLCGRAAPRS